MFTRSIIEIEDELAKLRPALAEVEAAIPGAEAEEARRERRLQAAQALYDAAVRARFAAGQVVNMDQRWVLVMPQGEMRQSRGRVGDPPDLRPPDPAELRAYTDAKRGVELAAGDLQEALREFNAAGQRRSTLHMRRRWFTDRIAQVEAERERALAAKTSTAADERARGWLERLRESLAVPAQKGAA